MQNKIYQVRKKVPSRNRLGIMMEGTKIENLQKNANKAKLNSLDYHIVEIEFRNKKNIVVREIEIIN